MSVKLCEGIRMDERPEPPPEGRLITAALQRSGMSMRQASRRANISYGRWRQIVTGYQNVSAGSFASVHHAPAATEARMAAVVGLAADELEKAGRADVAAVMREAPVAEDQPADWFAGLTPREKEITDRFIQGLIASREKEDNGREREDNGRRHSV